MFVIALRRDNVTAWLASMEPQRWGERDLAMRFETRAEARRTAAMLGVSGDWLIEEATDATPALIGSPGSL
jgi:hypothetical protein